MHLVIQNVAGKSFCWDFEILPIQNVGGKSFCWDFEVLLILISSGGRISLGSFLTDRLGGNLILLAGGMDVIF